MAKRKPLVDGEQLLLDLQELRERQHAIERLREKEAALREQYNATDLKRKDLKRQLTEIGWDIRNLCCLVTTKMRKLLDKADGATKEDKT